MPAEKVTQSDTRKRAMLSALESSLGIVSTACDAIGMSRQTHYEWMKTDTSYRQSVEELDSLALDFAESKLHEAIKSGNITGIIFFLKTKGRVRGYVERIEARIDPHGIQTLAPIRWADE